MPVDTEIPSTFEFAREWLVSSPLLVEVLVAGGPEPPTEPDRLEAARARVFCEEVWAEPDKEREGEAAPDLSPQVNPVPRATVMTVANRRRRVATGTFAGSGTLNIVIVALAPVEHRIDYSEAATSTDRATAFKARREWATQLMTQIREELLEMSGRSSDDGKPYLNAMSCDPIDPPMDLDEDEPVDGVAFVFEVEWQ